MHSKEKIFLGKTESDFVINCKNSANSGGNFHELRLTVENMLMVCYVFIKKLVNFLWVIL